MLALEVAFRNAMENYINIKASTMTQPEQSQQPQDSGNYPPGPPKAIGVYDRPPSKKIPSGLLIAVVLIILLSLLAFWLVPMLF